MHSSAHADTLAPRADGAAVLVGHLGNHQRLGRRFARKSRNHTISRIRNLESYADGGAAVHLQNAAKTTGWTDVRGQ